MIYFYSMSRNCRITNRHSKQKTASFIKLSEWCRFTSVQPGGLRSDSLPRPSPFLPHPTAQRPCSPKSLSGELWVIKPSWDQGAKRQADASLPFLPRPVSEARSPSLVFPPRLAGLSRQARRRATPADSAGILAHNPRCSEIRLSITPPTPRCK